MFGIGLPEMILIMALALIVVGPDKLPDLARSVAKGILELKKTANTIKENLTEEAGIINDLKPDLEQAAKNFRQQVLEAPDNAWKDLAPGEGVNPAPKKSAAMDLTDATIEAEIVAPTPVTAGEAETKKDPAPATPHETGKAAQDTQKPNPAPPQASDKSPE